MGESLNQPSRVKDEGSMDCKLLLSEGKKADVSVLASIRRISIGLLRASSRGNTEDASVIRIYWV